VWVFYFSTRHKLLWITIMKLFVFSFVKKNESLSVGGNLVFSNGLLDIKKFLEGIFIFSKNFEQYNNLFTLEVKKIYVTTQKKTYLFISVNFYSVQFFIFFLMGFTFSPPLKISPLEFKSYLDLEIIQDIFFSSLIPFPRSLLLFESSSIGS